MKGKIQIGLVGKKGWFVLTHSHQGPLRVERLDQASAGPASADSRSAPQRMFYPPQRTLNSHRTRHIEAAQTSASKVRSHIAWGQRPVTRHEMFYFFMSWFPSSSIKWR